MRGSANRLFLAETPTGRFLVKEFPYDVSLAGKRRAAQFEHEVWRSGRVPMPEPIPARDGELIVDATGSRGKELGMRVHRWMEGRPPVDVDSETVALAGAVLRSIQDAGSAFAPDAATRLRWWVTRTTLRRVSASPPTSTAP